MRIEGERIRIPRWIHAGPCVVRVEVEAVNPPEDAGEPCLESETVRWLDQLQQLAEAGQVEELEKVGEVYVRRSA